MRTWFTGKYRLVPITPEERARRNIPCHWWSRPLFDFILDENDPLTLHRSDCFEAQPCQTFVTDGGSIPKLIQVIPAFDSLRYPASYGFHDSAFKKHCWWTRHRSDAPFVKRQISFTTANCWLRTMLLAEGATSLTARTVYFFVRTIGRLAW